VSYEDGMLDAAIVQKIGEAAGVAGYGRNEVRAAGALPEAGEVGGDEARSVGRIGENLPPPELAGEVAVDQDNGALPGPGLQIRARAATAGGVPRSFDHLFSLL